MDKKVGVAVVGAGFVGGQAHVPAFNKIPGSAVVALGDRDEARIKKYSEELHVPYYLDYDRLLDDTKVDAVVLAVQLQGIQDRAQQLCLPTAPLLCSSFGTLQAAK